jgi:hypothetical protein
MPAAQARHHDARSAGHPVLTHRFLCPASRLPELRAALTQPITVGLILDSDDIGEALEDPRITVALVEVPPNRDPADLPEGVPVFFEGRDPHTVPSGFGAKLRCGGVKASLFPSVAEVAAFISACTASKVPFKATAGLHHAVRHTDPQTGFTHHGFLNLLLAVRAAVDGREGEMPEILRSTDSAALAAAARAVGAEQARAIRDLLVAYGSCSISAPLHHLTDLGLLEEPA